VIFALADLEKEQLLSSQNYITLLTPRTKSIKRQTQTPGILPVLSISTALWGQQFKGFGKLHHLPYRKTVNPGQLKLSHSLK
jgi:hypothetical protein